CAAHLGGGGRALHAQINAAGTRALLAAAQRAGVGRLVHLSTVAVYGRKDDGQVVRPADGYDPFPELRDDYAWSKIEAERWVHLYRRRGLDAVVLRPGIVYGGGGGLRSPPPPPAPRPPPPAPRPPGGPL